MPLYINLWYNTYVCIKDDNGDEFMDIRPQDILIMKKKHPCGDNRMLVLRSGMDFKLRCCGCGHEFMVPRSKIEKNVKKIERDESSGQT